MRYSNCCIVLLWLAAFAAPAQEPVTASVSKTRAAVNEIFYLTIQANGSDVKEPDLGPVAAMGLQLGPPSVQSSTSFESVNGKTSVMQSHIWRYPISAAQEGKLTIPRISIRVDGQEYFTQPQVVEITRALNMGEKSPGKETELTVEDLAFVRAVTDKTTVYQGEALTLRLQLYVLDDNIVSVSGPRSLPMPETEGFYPGPEWQDKRTEQYNGRSYQVTEFIRVFFPAMPGELLIGAWRWQGAVRWHDARRRVQSAGRIFATEEIPIKVLSLPEQPEGFGGAVGELQFKAQLTQNTLTQGTPVRLTLSVSGEGNPNTVSAPRLPDLPWAHVSGPETETRQKEHTAEFIKTFGYLLTPLETGGHKIPSVSFVYFAPLHEDYQTEQSREFEVTVNPAEGDSTFVAVGGSADEQRSRIQLLQDKILPIITEAKTLSSASRSPGEPLSTIALFSPGLPLLTFMLLSAFLVWRGRLARDRGYARRFFAKSKCLKSLKEARAAQDPSEALDTLLKGFIADMLNVNEAGLTSSDVEALLKERGVPEDTTTTTVRVLRACERARYAGRASGPDEANALYAATTTVVEQLHNALQEKK